MYYATADDKTATSHNEAEVQGDDDLGESEVRDVLEEHQAKTPAWLKAPNPDTLLKHAERLKSQKSSEMLEVNSPIFSATFNIVFN